MLLGCHVAHLSHHALPLLGGPWLLSSPGLLLKLLLDLGGELALGASWLLHASCSP